MDEGCLFCKIVSGEVPASKVYEDDDFLAFLDIKPINIGHTLLIPKKHYRNLFDLPDDLLSKMGPILKKLAQAVRAGTSAEGVNIGWNNELPAGQLIFHSHVHIMPRHTGDGHKHWTGRDHHTTEEFSQIANQIKKLLP